MKGQDLDTQSSSLAEGKQFLNGGNVKIHEVTHHLKERVAKCHKHRATLSNVLQRLCLYFRQATTLKNLKQY